MPTKTSAYDVAKFLLDDGFILTALEFHTELMEQGQQLRCLVDYFSNPVNFETSSSKGLNSSRALKRTPSSATFDSLDMSHNSDQNDASVDDRLAVAEFELRKAKETIQSLRTQLTSITEQQHPHDPIITARSSESTQATNASTSSINEKRVEVMTVPHVAHALPHELRAMNFLVHEYLLNNHYKMTAVTLCDECSEQDFEDWDDVGINIARPPNLLHMFRQHMHNTPGYVQTKSQHVQCEFEATTSPVQHCENNHDDDDLGVDTTDLINRLNTENNELMQANQQLLARAEQLETEITQLKAQVETLKKAEKARNIQPVQPTKTLELHLPPMESHDSNVHARNVPRALIDALSSSILTESIPDNRVSIFEQVQQMPDSLKSLTTLLCTTLPRIIPHMMLDERDQLLPLLISAAHLTTDNAQRTMLLQAMLDLFKRPNATRRQLIVVACTQLAAIAHQGVLEESLLPVCWEHMTHKTAEHRQMTAQVCAALVPYVPQSLLGSLILSMLQQLLVDEKNEQVRCATVQALSLLCVHIDDRSRFARICDLVQRACTDTSESVQAATQQALLPAFAYWAMELNLLYSDVLIVLLDKAAGLLKTLGANQLPNESILCAYLNSVNACIAACMMEILNSNTSLQEAINDASFDLDNRIGANSTLLQYYDNQNDLKRRLINFDRITSEEWFKTWSSIDRLQSDILPKLISVFSQMQPNLRRAIQCAITLIQHLCRLLGREFVKSKVDTLFITALANAQNAHGALLPIYCCGVVMAYKEDADPKALRELLIEKLHSCTEETKLDSVEALSTTFSLLYHQCRDKMSLLAILCETVAHENCTVRVACATIIGSLIAIVDVALLKSRLLPAMVTLASDDNGTVRQVMPHALLLLSSTIKNDSGTMDKICTQLETLFTDSNVEVLTRLVRAVALNSPALDATLRDDFILPHLAKVSQQAAALPTEPAEMAKRRRALLDALFEAHSALSCCNLSSRALSDSFLPGMRHLLTSLDNEHIKIASSILHDAEFKLQQAMPTPIAETTQQAIRSDEVKTRVFSTLKEFKERMHDSSASSGVGSIFRKK